MDEIEKNDMAEAAAAAANKVEAARIQDGLAQGAINFFQDHPEVEQDADLIAIEVAKIQPDRSADVVSDTYRRLDEAAKKVKERKAKFSSPDKNVPGPEQLTKSMTLTPAPKEEKEEQEIRGMWVNDHRDRQKKVRLRWDM